jgi:hypothetical protein
MIPSATVFTADDSLVYKGRIDDRFADLGRERPQASTHDFRDILDPILANRPVAVSSTKAVGYYIP